MLVVGLVVGFILGYTVSNYNIHHFLINSLDITQIDDGQKVQVIVLIILSSLIFSFLVFMPIKKIINGFEQIDKANAPQQANEGAPINDEQKSVPTKQSQNILQRYSAGNINPSSHNNSKM